MRKLKNSELERISVETSNLLKDSNCSCFR